MFKKKLHHLKDNPQKLIRYLFDEIEDSEKQIFDKHLQICDECYNEVANFRKTKSLVENVELVSPSLESIQKIEEFISNIEYQRWPVENKFVRFYQAIHRFKQRLSQPYLAVAEGFIILLILIFVFIFLKYRLAKNITFSDISIEQTINSLKKDIERLDSELEYTISSENFNGSKSYHQNTTG